MSEFGTELARLMAARGVGVRELARLVPCNPGHVSNLRTGRDRASAELAARLDDVLGAGGELLALVPAPGRRLPGAAGPGADDEIAALELARRAEASDVGSGAVERLELIVDDLAIAYPATPAADLLTRARTHLGYVGRLLDARATLSQHRRLLVTGGWLSLLAAPHASSAHLQAVAQEGRAWARVGDAAETRRALTRLEMLVSPLPVPDQPEHHYRYDPPKSEAYVATTLAWVGDPAAEGITREVLATVEAPGTAPPRPRRAALARLDLALVLSASGKDDEAAAMALEAIRSGRLAPVDGRRVRDIVRAVTASHAPGAGELAEAYRDDDGGEPPALR